MTTDANALLGAANTARAQARRARQGYWFPLLVFGALIERLVVGGGKPTPATPVDERIPSPRS